jgi:hypothetical protein
VNMLSSPSLKVDKANLLPSAAAAAAAAAAVPSLKRKFSPAPPRAITPIPEAAGQKKQRQFARHVTTSDISGDDASIDGLLSRAMTISVTREDTSSSSYGGESVSERIVSLDDIRAVVGVEEDRVVMMEALVTRINELQQRESKTTSCSRSLVLQVFREDTSLSYGGGNISLDRVVSIDDMKEMVRVEEDRVPVLVELVRKVTELQVELAKRSRSGSITVPQ